MAKFLIFPYSNQLGSTIPTVTLANLLILKGHEVIFASNGQYTHVLKDKHFEVVPINEISYKQYREHLDNNNVNYYSEGLVRHFVDMEVDLINQVKPDLIISNNRPTTKISSKVTNKPLVTVVIPTLNKFYDYKYFIPDNHFLNRYFPFDVNKFVPSGFNKFVLNKTMARWVINFNKILEYYNLSPIKDYFEANEGDITLINQTYGLFPFKNLPDKYYFLEQSLESTFGTSHKWIEDLDRYKKEGKKIIFVSMGSSALEGFPLVIRNVAEMVLENPDKYVLVSNHVGLDNDFKDRKNIFIEKFINTAEVLPHVDIVVTHGGVNTLSECLLAKKPVIGIPEQGEQLWNIKYIEYLGVGKHISKEILKKNNNILSETIVHVLSDKKYLHNLEDFIQKNVNEADIVDHKSSIVRAIESLI